MKYLETIEKEMIKERLDNKINYHYIYKFKVGKIWKLAMHLQRKQQNEMTLETLETGGCLTYLPSPTHQFHLSPPVFS